MKEAEKPVFESVFVVHVNRFGLFSLPFADLLVAMQGMNGNFLQTEAKVLICAVLEATSMRLHLFEDSHSSEASPFQRKSAQLLC